MRKILVPIDFSDVTELVIEKAKFLAKSLDAELRVVHVAPPITDAGVLRETVGGITITPLNYEALRDEFATELKIERKKMLEIKNKLSDEKIRVQSILVEGNVLETVLSQAKEYVPDMIIMGSHGHGCIAKALLGSATMSVLKHVECPVMVVPSKSKNSP